MKILIYWKIMFEIESGQIWLPERSNHVVLLCEQKDIKENKKIRSKNQDTYLSTYLEDGVLQSIYLTKISFSKFR